MYASGDLSGNSDCLTSKPNFNFSLLARSYETPAEKIVIQDAL
jgi:hypothetical protein